tara:strand:- start:105 stop:284 length:180 start_codon:yes stop_codon:yes gene_type:complete
MDSGTGEEMSDFDIDFMLGQTDCREGVEHVAGMSDAYNRGYAAEYQHQENLTALQERRA